MLIEIHLLQNHAPSNLNRDDTGSPKDCVFGGVRRARISSQCLKRTIRRSEAFQTAMAGHLAKRTRRLPELVRRRLLEKGISPDMAAAAAQKVTGFGTSDGREKGVNKKTGEFETAQTMFLTEADIAAVTDVMREACQSAGTVAALNGLKAVDLQAKARPQGFRPISVDVALFGRMTTSEALRDVEAAAQVAHALSTHKVEPEYDYFTAVDDLAGTAEEEEDAGADMIGDVEFNSACYYQYLSIDFKGLCDNLTGARLGRPNVTEEDRKAAQHLGSRAMAALIRAAVTVAPTGKQNTFASHTRPAAVLVEVRPARTPVSYANAFVDPARAGKGDDLVRDSVRKLAAHVEALTRGFNLQADPRLLLAPEHPDFQIEGFERVADLNTLCQRVEQVCQEWGDA